MIYISNKTNRYTTVILLLLVTICLLILIGSGEKRGQTKKQRNIEVEVIEEKEQKNTNVTVEVVEDYTSITAGISRSIYPIIKLPMTKSSKIKKDKFEPYDMYITSNVHMRKKPNKKSESIKILESNTSVRVIGKHKKWSKVKFDGTKGYIKTKYLSKDITPVKDLNRWGIELTDEEIDLLALIVYKEGGGESVFFREAIVEVIFNRMISKSFGGDLYSVLSAKGQFSTWGNRHSASPKESDYEAIYNVLNGKTNIFGFDYLYFSTTKANGHDFVNIDGCWFSKGK